MRAIWFANWTVDRLIVAGGGTLASAGLRPADTDADDQLAGVYVHPDPSKQEKNSNKNKTPA